MAGGVRDKEKQCEKRVTSLRFAASSHVVRADVTGKRSTCASGETERRGTNRGALVHQTTMI